MAKKNLKSIVNALTPIASDLPTQHIKRQPTNIHPTVVDEPVVQFGFSLRKELRKELSRLADDTDMTMRSFILMALRDKGLSVREDDLLDLRKDRSA